MIALISCRSRRDVEAWKYDRMGNITASVKDRKVSQRTYNGLNQLLEQSGGGVIPLARC